MMQMLHGICATLRAALIAVSGLILTAVAGATLSGVGPPFGEWWSIGLQAIEAAPHYAFFVGWVLLAIEVVYWGTRPRLQRRTDELTCRGPNGEVTVAADLVVNELRELAGEFPDIVAMEPRVLPRRNAMDIQVDLEVRSGCASAPLCRSLHDRLTEFAGERFGMFEIHDIHLRITDIVREAARPRAADDPAENRTRHVETSPAIDAAPAESPPQA